MNEELYKNILENKKSCHRAEFQSQIQIVPKK